MEFSSSPFPLLIIRESREKAERERERLAPVRSSKAPCHHPQTTTWYARRERGGILYVEESEVDRIRLTFSLSPLSLHYISSIK
jgi:hypothetical protein